MTHRPLSLYEVRQYLLGEIEKAQMQAYTMGSITALMGAFTVDEPTITAERDAKIAELRGKLALVEAALAAEAETIVQQLTESRK